MTTTSESLLFDVVAHSSRLLSGAKLLTTSGCSARAPVALDA